MKKKYFILSSILLGILSVLLIIARLNPRVEKEFFVDTFGFEILTRNETDKTGTVLCFNSSQLDGDLIIPSTIEYKGYKYVITEVGNMSYIGENDYGLFGEGDFYSYKTITIPNTVKKINDTIFKNIETLETVYIPESVEEIGSGAFTNCKNIKNINIDPKNNFFKYENGTIFSKDGKELVSVVEPFEVYKIPEGVEVIKQMSFHGDNKLGNINLKKITFSSSVKEIERAAFRDCKELEIIELNEGLREIREKAFYSCSKLKTVVLPSSVRILEKRAFSQCDIETLELNDGLEEIGNNAFSENLNLDSSKIDIPDSVWNLGGSIFDYTMNQGQE